ncbi:hypothetical protein ACIA5D_15285 [Actinoplanes sp. NPDC051513]|uniref:hypothetical protein n=1 Tax=Actinoplanes sp. NPDC051513 TaxID=3363908 RepID=UPI003792B50B
MSADPGFQVQADTITRHATTVDRVADQVAEGRGAAAAVSIGRDAYGILCSLIPSLLEPVPSPDVRAMSVGELRALVERADVYRAKAVFELAARAGRDDAAVAALSAASHLPHIRNDRIFHRVSLAWGAIIGLLAAKTPGSRNAAYAAFADLGPADREDLLTYLRVDAIEDAHPDPL